MSKTKWATAAGMLACTGALVAYGFSGQAGAGTAPGAAAGTAAVPGKSAATGGASVLSGERQVTIVRAQAFESGLSMSDDGKLVEADDDSGRQLFVPTPLGEGRYLVKAYTRANDHPAADEPSCWQVHNPQTSEPLTVEAAPCDADNPDQWFTITRSGKRTYAISNASAYLQHSPSRGLILEELGDAPLRSTFRFVDNGPAPTVGD